jgi:hypothetical protein
MTIEDAKARLEDAGLHVLATLPHGLIIVDEMKGGESRDFQNDCSLFTESGRWRFLCPDDQTDRAYEIDDDSLDGLMMLLLRVCQERRIRGGSLAEAIRRTVPAAGKYLRVRARPIL